MPKQESHSMGRPWAKIDLDKVEALAAQGLTNEQIALSIGIVTSTLYKRKRENKAFEEAINRGKAKGLATISNALFNDAKKGNTTAQIFYLKTRDRANWNDSPVLGIDGGEAPPLQINFEVAEPVNDITVTRGEEAPTDEA